MILTPIQWEILRSRWDTSQEKTLVHLAKRPFVTLCGRSIPDHALVLKEDTQLECKLCLHQLLGYNLKRGHHETASGTSG